MRTWPLVSSSSPARQCIRVDLPEPDGPMMAVKAPATKAHVDVVEGDHGAVALAVDLGGADGPGGDRGFCCGRREAGNVAYESHDAVARTDRSAGVPRLSSACRLDARTMAALQARMARNPTHWRASPEPSPQYGLEGPISTGIPWKNVKVTISIHATTAATLAAARCRTATRMTASSTAAMLDRCCGLVNVSSDAGYGVGS